MATENAREKDTEYKHFCGRLKSEHLALDLLVETVGAHNDAADGETLVDTGHFVFPIKVYRHLMQDERGRALYVCECVCMCAHGHRTRTDCMCDNSLRTQQRRRLILRCL